uniref:DUF4806 domain-containing protein n=1 Tax=Schizaphis graminum TaxID=13262 RepID=A0A2S2NH74_SCHGA
MNSSLSYRTKRRRIVNELLAIENSDDDDTVLNTQTLATTPILNNIEASDINYNECLNNGLQPSLNIPLNDQTLLEPTESIPAGDFIKNVNCTQEQNVKDSLKEWATNYNIPQNALNALLNVLKFDVGLNYLPKDSRTLLQCKSTKITNIRNVNPRGYYYHFGLSAGIIKLSSQIALTDTVKIAVGVDGLPLSASSSSQFWPILAYIMPHHEHVFPIGIYYGQEKPHNSDEFLKDFISEVILLTTNGISINGAKKKIVIEVMCCDAPAKAFLLKVKGHSGFFSCTRCTVEGEYLQNRVCFPYLANGSTIRTHEDYVLMKYEEHHTSLVTSCISSIPNVDVVQLFSMDYMHMVCLGVMRKLINIWMGNTKGPINVRIPSWKINQISNALHAIKKNHITKDFSRKPRALIEINRWKATELRQFLLYTGIIVLKDVLSDGCYQNFLILCISMRILLSAHHQQYVNYAQKLLDYFVKTFEQLYGSHLISFNVHGLLHLTEDYKKYGPLDNCSTFPFENYMKYLKRMLRKHDKPLQQVIKRYEEQCNSIKNNNEKNKDILNLTEKKPNCYALTKQGEVIKIDSIIKSKEDHSGTDDNIIGKIFLIKNDFFEINNFF